MGDLHSELHQNKGIKASEGARPLDNGALSTRAWSNSLNEPARQGLSADVALEDAALFPLFSEPSLGLILKMSTSLVQPVCFGGAPVALPVHLQVTGGADPQVAQTIGTTVIAPNPGSLCLPLILDKPGLQYLSSQLLLHSSCLIPEEQPLPGAEENHGQNPSVPLSQPQHAEEKPEISPQPLDCPPLHCSKFTTDPFPFFRNCAASSFQGTRSLSSNPFSAAFLPQDSTLPYPCTGSPLVSIVPPATLLVPYPLVVPLPVPLPIPVPIPVPFPDSKAFSGSFSTSRGTKKNKSTQTSVDNSGLPMSSENRKPDCHFLQLGTLPPASPQEVLDLRIKVTPVQTEQEVRVSLPQDSALDLSVANSSHFRSCGGGTLKYPGINSTSEEPKEVVRRPLKYSQRHDPGHLSGRSKTELGIQYKWTLEERFDKITSKPPGQRGSFMRPLQRSTVGCKNLARQPQEHILKNKLKRVSSQNINICPIKKQHLATFLPGS